MKRNVCEAQPLTFTDREFSMCGGCEHGWIDFAPEACGWTRLPRHDRVLVNDGGGQVWEEAWRTAGGALYMHPRGIGPLKISTLCDCVRAAMNIPLRSIEHVPQQNHLPVSHPRHP